MVTLLTALEQAAGMLVVSSSYASGLDNNVYAGRANTIEALPMTVVSAESAEQYIYDSGIYKVGLLIQVQEKAIDTSVTSSLGETVYKTFGQANVNTQLNNLSSGSLFVYQIDVDNFRSSIGTEDKTWIQELNLNVICGLMQ